MSNAGLSATPRSQASRDDWARALDIKPILDAPLERDKGCTIRRWRGTHPDVRQPGLDEHYVVLHLGGAKRVHRRGGRSMRTADIDLSGISIVPSGAAYDWHTEGPIEYAHIYIPPKRLIHAAETIFDRHGDTIRLLERLGDPDPLLAPIFGALMETAAQRASLYTEVLTEAFLARLVQAHTTLNETRKPARYALPPRRLHAVLDYVEANIDRPITLDALAGIARLSRFHFARAFARATGATPHAFVMERRLLAARAMLRTTDLPIAAVAAQCGFASASHLSNNFAARFGVRPGGYRNAL